MHAIDGLLDVEGAGIREPGDPVLLHAPADHDTRSAAQRRADTLVTMARFVVEHHHLPTGVKRRKPKIIATIAYTDLVARSGVG